MHAVRRGTAVLLQLLLVQFTLAGSGLLACETAGVAVAAHGSVMPGMPAQGGHGAPCRTPSPDRRGDCSSQPSLPGGCAQSAACAAPAGAPANAVVVSVRTTHDEPLGVSDAAPASRHTAPEPPPPRA